MNIPKLALIDAVQGVVDQGGASISQEYGCAYRGEEGRKCIVGQLIDDEYYVPEMEEIDIYESRVQKAVGKSLGCFLDEEDITLLDALQFQHDSPSFSSVEAFQEDCFLIINKAYEDNCITA